VWTLARVKRRTILDEADVVGLEVGVVVNPVDPRLSAQKVYKESRILAREAEKKESDEITKAARRDETPWEEGRREKGSSRDSSRASDGG
jgi:hypothetical protein